MIAESFFCPRVPGELEILEILGAGGKNGGVRRRKKG
jgi:hypothetical protein